MTQLLWLALGAALAQPHEVAHEEVHGHDEAHEHAHEAHGAAHEEHGEEHGCAGEHAGHGHGEGKVDVGTLVIALTGVVLLIIVLLIAFEKTVAFCKEKIDKVYLPVINGALSEIATLGFIGLLVQFLEHYFEEQIGELSVAATGDHHALVLGFEWFHMKFFEVAILYFLFCGWLLLRTVRRAVMLTAKIKQADKDQDGTVTTDEFQTAFGADSLQKYKLTMWEKARTGELGPTMAEQYLLQRRFITKNNLPKHFQTTHFRAHVASEALTELVELNPLAWLLMLPPLVYMEVIKIKAGAPMDDDEHKTAGAFLAQPVMIFFLVVFEVMGVGMPLPTHPTASSARHAMRCHAMPCHAMPCQTSACASCVSWQRGHSTTMLS